MILTVKGGLLDKNTELVGKMDPYCVVKYLKKEYKSKVHNSGGKEPIWDDQFTLEVGKFTTDITFTVFDDDIGSDDLIGEAKLKMSTFVFAQ